MKNWQFSILTGLLLIIIFTLIIGTPLAHRIESKIIDNGIRIDSAQASLDYRKGLFDSIFTDLRYIHENLDSLKSKHTK